MELVVTDQAAEGWMTGHPVGRPDMVGMFPADYVQASADAGAGAGAADAGDTGDGAEAQGGVAVVRAKVLHDYASTDEGFLSLTAGMELVVTEQTDGGW